MESGINIKVVQEVIGHTDIAIALNIYASVTKELARREFDNMEEKLPHNADSVNKDAAKGDEKTNSEE